MTSVQETKNQHIIKIQKEFIKITKDCLDHGVSLKDLKYVSIAPDIKGRSKQTRLTIIKKFIVLNRIKFIVIFILLFSILMQNYIVTRIMSARCLVPNNYLVWEFTRPVSDCEFCRGVTRPLILPGNTTREEFKKFAYSSRPIIVKKAAKHWLAKNVFSLRFFRNLYESISDAYESVEEECQFLHFKSNFANLKEVLSMNDRRALNLPGEEPWYIGWKNCHPQVLDIMKKFYEIPQFLPEDAEIPNSNYIFLGYEQGAVMHLDYIPRLMWQGQIIGSKTWTVAPTPECENVCEKFQFFVDTGDIILLDTRIWYHGTQVENGKFSLTVTSEYG